MGKKAVVVLAEGFEEIEATTVIDVLRRAEVEVNVLGLKEGAVEGSRGVKIIPDRKLSSEEDADAIILPGGMPGAKNLADSEDVNNIVKKFAQQGKIVGAICASPAVVLSGTGVLNGRRATCYPGMEDGFGRDTKFVKEDVVIDGNLITGRGPAMAAKFAFALVEKLASEETAKELKKKMLFT